MPNLCLSTSSFRNDILVFKKTPILIYVGHLSDEPSFHFPSHSHDSFCEMLYLRKGTAKFIINDRTYHAKSGDIIIFNQGIVHEEFYETDQETDLYYCAIGNLAFEGLEEGRLILDNVSPVISCSSYGSRVDSFFAELFHESTTQSIGFASMFENLLKSLLIFLLRTLNEKYDVYSSYKSSSLGEQIKNFIDNNYYRDISLKEIAQSLYVSQHYLSHIFKSEQGQSPINYLIQRRIEEAKKLLLNTNKPFQEISRLVGYENSNHFNLLFKKMTGYPPGKYKRQVDSEIKRFS